MSLILRKSDYSFPHGKPCRTAENVVIFPSFGLGAYFFHISLGDYLVICSKSKSRMRASVISFLVYKPSYACSWDILSVFKEYETDGEFDLYVCYNYNIIMDDIIFQWDEHKNSINKKKHHISFEEAQTVFEDTEALIIDDPDYSIGEERFIILGFSNQANLLVVCHCYRDNDNIIRIISARRATPHESQQYTQSF